MAADQGICSCVRMHHIDGAVKAVELVLTGEEIAYLEEPYVPHSLVGVMAENSITASKEKHS